MSEQSPYIDVQWLSFHTRGMGLHRGNIMSYFYSSPFFDSSSCNAAILSQTSIWQEQASLLVNMTGFQYVLDEQNINEPNLFVIKKLHRQSPRVIEVLNVYYCFEGVIYQGPGLLNLIETRITKVSNHLLKSFLLATTTPQAKEESSVPISRQESADMYIPREYPSLALTTRDILSKSFFG
jgi:hypothetical protein